ncbi:hypothetical protein SAMN02745218_01559 [Desulfofundulus australicus DSM 11792]|uniref:Thioredoxin domain-containing protein n=1 Tax=Desulfofundulus australicus DSM 11792 TaxID=1121425 RepID=A0A1M4ZB45_9FIRM|nr:hypothetical protein [Desulfofundulus australicus]SHF14992.1 hypothetical protein SAMN02745218_01559 [Desulfofundulus australicus DSM 11792]
MKSLRLELIYAGDHNLSCYYAAKVVEAVVPLFPHQVEWEKVYILHKDGARRFYELSISLYGEDKVKKLHMYAPIPSIFVNGKMVFDRIPSVEELAQVIEEFIYRGGNGR